MGGDAVSRVRENERVTMGDGVTRRRVAGEGERYKNN